MSGGEIDANSLKVKKEIFNALFKIQGWEKGIKSRDDGILQ